MLEDWVFGEPTTKGYDGALGEGKKTLVAVVVAHTAGAHPTKGNIVLGDMKQRIVHRHAT